jgi:hypothetical protein
MSSKGLGICRTTISKTVRTSKKGTVIRKLEGLLYLVSQPTQRCQSHTDGWCDSTTVVRALCPKVERALRCCWAYQTYTVGQWKEGCYFGKLFDQIAHV